jgi:hypothetical protein
MYGNSAGAGGTAEKPTGPGAFAARVTWTTAFDATRFAAGSTAKTWSGKSGGVKPYVGPEGVGCLAHVGFGTGYVTIQLLNNRFPAADSCAVADTVLAAISARTR